MDKNYFPGCTCDKCRAYIPPNYGVITQDFRLICRECAEKEKNDE